MEDAMFLGILNLFSSWIFFALHVDSMGVFPKPLSKQKEEEYFEKMAKGDKEAKNKLIEHNLRLVVYLSKKYENTKIDLEDLELMYLYGYKKFMLPDGMEGEKLTKALKGWRMFKYE